MPIDIAAERLILVRDVPAYMPLSRHGRPIHLSAVYRWMTQGVCGVRLPTVYIAGHRYTSAEALSRYWADVTSARDRRSQARLSRRVGAA